jgi:4-amino-4-deoxy-L-arabinose transferase-like glycosyltransferase
MSTEPRPAGPADQDEEKTFVQPPPPLRLVGDDEGEARSRGEIERRLSDEARAFWEGGEAPALHEGSETASLLEAGDNAPGRGRPYRMYVVEEAAYPAERGEAEAGVYEVPETEGGGAGGTADTAVHAPRVDLREAAGGQPDGSSRLELLAGGVAASAAGGAVEAAPEAVELPPPRRTYAPAEESPSSPARGLPVRIAAGLGVRVSDLLTLGGLLAVAGLVHAWGMGRFPAFFDDEGTYVSQAWAVVKLHALAPYTYWYDHPPFGWLQLAGWSSLFPSFGSDQAAIPSARTFMLVVALAAAACVYVIARRMQLARPFAALAVLLFTLSPLALWYQRMVLLDNIGLFWLLLALVLALTPQGRLFAYGAAGVALAGAVLTKETFLLFVPAVALAVWQTSRATSRRFAIAVFLTLFVLVGSFYPLFALLRGELVPGEGHTSLIHGIAYQLTRPGTGSITDAGSQTFAVVRGWLQTDPWILWLALLALPLGLVLRRSRPVGLALLIPALMLLRPDGYLPAMYVIGLLPFAALLIAVVADWGWASARSFEWGRMRRVRRPPSKERRAAHVYRSAETRWTGAGRVTAMVAGGVLVAALLLGAARAWPAADRAAMTADAAAPSRAAVSWLDEHASRRAYLLVDNSVWTDLVDRGFKPGRTIWYSKLDLDPSLGGTRWNRFTYVVRSNLVRLRDWGPNARAVWAHGRTVATFGHGKDWVKIRKVGRVTQFSTQTGSGPQGGPESDAWPLRSPSGVEAKRRGTRDAEPVRHRPRSRGVARWNSIPTSFWTPRSTTFRVSRSAP